MERGGARIGKRSQPAPPGGKEGRALVLAIVAYAGTLVALITLLRCVGDRAWFTALLLFGPRWPWALPLLVLAPLAWRRRRRWLWAVAACAVLVLSPLLDLTLSPRSLLTGRSVPDLRILSCNVEAQASDPAPFSRLVENTPVDIILLQECSEPWAAQVIWPLGWHRHHYKGQFLASRFPIASTTIVGNDVLPEYGTIVRYDLQTPRGVVHVFNAHLESPRWGMVPFLQGEKDGLELFRACLKRRQNAAEYASLFVRGVAGPVIVAGDFNMPADSPTFRACWSGYVDAFSAIGNGFGNTKWSGWWGTRLDHVLLGREFKALRCEVGPDVGSDHRPVFADLRWR